MRPRDSRNSIKALGKLCKRNGIEMTVETGRGRGSHRSLMFKDEKTGEVVAFVIPDTKEISPGVQRGAGNYFRDLATRLAVNTAARELAEAVRALWDGYFNG